MNVFTASRSDDAGELVMGGSLTIENAGEIRRILLATFERSDCVVMSIAEDTQIDISFLQVLCAAHHTAVKTNKTFELAQTPKVFLRAVEDAGYRILKGCIHDRDGTCLWVRGGQNE
jgi:anti-anti-sigma regulatory factor